MFYTWEIHVWLQLQTAVRLTLQRHQKQLAAIRSAETLADAVHKCTHGVETVLKQI